MYGIGQTEFKSLPTSKTQILAVMDRDLQATEQLERHASGKSAGY